MRRTPLARRTPLRRANPERRARAYARNFGERADRIRSMPCAVTCSSCSGRIVAAHAVPRGMGGARGDRRLLVPLCWRHHEEAGEARTSQRAAFEVRFNVCLRALAAKLAALLDGEGLE